MSQSNELESLRKLRAEVEACLNHCPHTVRYHEGGGFEDIAASLALTMARMTKLIKDNQ